MSGLGQIINVAKLEEVIVGMQMQLEEQASVMADLQRQLAAKVDVKDQGSSEQRQAAHIKQLETRLLQLEERAANIEVHTQQLNDTAMQLDNVHQALNAKVDVAAYDADRDNTMSSVNENFGRLMADKASKGVVQSVEDSQHRLLEQVMAFQKMLACKVDRVEIPLLHAAADKMQTLLEFKKATDPRLAGLEESLKRAEAALNEKESKLNMVQRMQKINEILVSKADKSWIEEDVLTTLHSVKQATSNITVDADDVAAVRTQHVQLMKGYEKANQLMDTLSNETQLIAARHQELEKRMVEHPTKGEISEMIAADLKTYQSWVEEIRSSTSQENKVNAAYVTDLRTKLTDVKRHQNAADKKLEVAMRFIDWYADVQNK